MRRQLLRSLGARNSGIDACSSGLIGRFGAMFLLLAVVGWAAVGGSISGTVKDATGGVIPGAMVTVTNVALRTEYRTMTDGRGYFSFPNLAVGRYDLTIEIGGFKPQKKNGLVIDIDTAR